MSDRQTDRPAQDWWLWAILALYLALGTLFATLTPAWQNPDEPAHYNYIRHLVEQGELPRLKMGDYDGEYLSRLTSERFPADLSIEPVRYEAHQPPLYYLLAIPVYLVSGGSLLLLRLFSLVLGGGVIIIVFLTARQIFPHRPEVAPSAAAFVAFLPMHLAMMASVNNDALAELLIAATLYLLLRWSRLEPSPQRDRFLILCGLLTGLGLLTKATAYVLLPLLVSAIVLTAPISTWLPRLFRGLTPAVLIALPLWIRNVLVYGGLDFLGLAWHDRVVSGQPTTIDWIAREGWSAYWERAVEFTFRSFWGVFGWMALFLDARIYTFLALLSGLILVGLLIWFWRHLTGERRLSRVQRRQMLILLLLWLGVWASYVWYNLGFVQHQGRYLFPALMAWGIFVAIGWQEIISGRSLPISLILLLLAAVGSILVQGTDFDPWFLFQILTLWFLAGILWLGYRTHLSLSMRRLASAAPFLFLILLDALIPFMYIEPYLSP